jgi:hypothetical protein
MVFNGQISFDVWIHLKCTGGLAASVVTVSSVGNCRITRNSKETVHVSAGSVQRLSTYRTNKTPRTLHFICNASVHCVPMPVALQSKASACGLSLAGNACSNPAGGMDVCLLWVFCDVS